jgi:hypothetical protein
MHRTGVNAQNMVVATPAAVVMILAHRQSQGLYPNRNAAPSPASSPLMGG